jgi:F-type H+-transporting ATPase subunit a
VRLFANMFAGHTVTAIILGFIVMAKSTEWYMFWPISIGSALMVTALSCLELFVAFLQAFIFVFLTSLFIGSALHPAH